MKLEEITIPDTSTVSPEMWAQTGAIAIVVILLSIAWSRPVIKYALIGAMILAGILFVAKQGGMV